MKNSPNLFCAPYNIFPLCYSKCNSGVLNLSHLQMDFMEIARLYVVCYKHPLPEGMHGKINVKVMIMNERMKQN